MFAQSKPIRSDTGVGGEATAQLVQCCCMEPWFWSLRAPWVAYACNFSAREVETGRSDVQGCAKPAIWWVQVQHTWDPISKEKKEKSKWIKVSFILPNHLKSLIVFMSTVNSRFTRIHFNICANASSMGHITGYLQRSLLLYNPLRLYPHLTVGKWRVSTYTLKDEDAVLSA